uniref:Uncharacterized protein n=1 Tax=Panagrolaimus sp. PS1159 TaxID=55785 RepID=A0AC35GGJ3_9BILA
MQLQKYKLFKSQNVDNGHFDVEFDIDGKIRYAKRYFLATSSETLNAWLSDRWSTKDIPIKIKSYYLMTKFDFFGCN